MADAKFTASLADRFWSKVDKRGPDECWPWAAHCRRRDGRGCFSLKGVSRPAPRVAFILTHGVEPSGYACHTCDNPKCCNPAHLWDGTHSENMRDMSLKGRGTGQNKTHCAQGHPYSPENTLWRNDGIRARECRTCLNIRRAARRAKERAEGPPA